MKHALKIYVIYVLFLSIQGTAVAEDEIWKLTDLHGFLGYRAGAKFQPDQYTDDITLNELRLQLEMNKTWHYATIQLKSDFIYDDTIKVNSPDLEDGTGWIDLREAYILLYPSMYADIKLGRQVLTWGAGDLLFINDIFPKDWQSFFIGRDENYLKAPSDALMVSLFPGFANIDLVYMPRFDSSRYVSGQRISLWNPMQERITGDSAVISPVENDEWFVDDETAARIYKNVGGTELAVYGYSGFWKTPRGFDPAVQKAFFPELNVYGASLRGTAAGGVVSLEAGYYDSTEDRSGNDPLVPNSEIRALAGYERELIKNFTAKTQWYIEHMLEYESYEANAQGPLADEDRHVLTLRLTATALRDDLIVSLFTYYSPTDEDYYSRPVVTYKLRDNLELGAGANIFGGKYDHTFFGQFEENSNYYASIKKSF